MRLPHRREFLRLASSVAAMPAFPRLAKAQAYPSRAVRIVVGFPPGTATDITARLIGQWFSDRLGQPFIIENRPGAGSNTAAESVVRAPADGYTLLLVGATNAINATLYDKLNFNVLRDIAPIGGLIRAPYVNRCKSVIICQNHSGIHRLCQGQSRQAQHGVVRLEPVIICRARCLR
jgi:tripartite-type tricarboxylate transporter receptor subunit TctC